ncbi:MAG: DUF624 domain-containing protein [Bacillota bacterium]|nr:DUF624 domain-containing protein [Bacillota bacterium]
MAGKDFFDRPLYKITNYIYWFLTANIYFMLLNVLLILFLTGTTEPSQINPGFYFMLFIVCLPLGPTFTALLAVMGKLVREKEVSITREYFRSLKQNFKQSMMAWFVVMLLLTVFSVDIYFFSTKASGAFFIPIFYAFIIVLLILTLYIFPIISRFYLKTTDVFKLSFYLTIKKYKVTFFNIFAVAVSVYVVRFIPFAILFFGSVVSYALMYYEKDVLKELEEKIISSSNTGGEEKEEVEDEGEKQDIEYTLKK